MKHELGFEILDHTVETVTLDPFAGAGCKEIPQYGAGGLTWARCLVQGPNGKTIAFAAHLDDTDESVLEVIVAELTWDELTLAALGCKSLAAEAAEYETDFHRGLASGVIGNMQGLSIYQGPPSQFETLRGDQSCQVPTTATGMRLLRDAAAQNAATQPILYSGWTVDRESLRGASAEQLAALARSDSRDAIRAAARDELAARQKCPIGNGNPVSGSAEGSELPSGKIVRPEWAAPFPHSSLRQFRFGLLRVDEGYLGAPVHLWHWNGSGPYDGVVERCAAAAIAGLADITAAFAICEQNAEHWSQL